MGIKDGYADGQEGIRVNQTVRQAASSTVLERAVQTLGVR